MRTENTAFCFPPILLAIWNELLIISHTSVMGNFFFTGSKDEFVDMFRIVKGGMDELSADLQAKAVGVRTFPTGFEALVKTEDIGSFTALDIEPATIDEIVVFTSKKGEDYE